MDETDIPKNSPRTLPNGLDDQAPTQKIKDPMDASTMTSLQPGSRGLSRALEKSDLSGMTLGGYRLVRKVAEGGMGVVYEAIQTKLDRKVALKVLTEELSILPEFLKRFEREAKAAAALNHPNLVQVHDFGEVGNRYYMIMEFVDGEDLSSYVHSHGKLSVLEGLSVVEQAAQALKTAFEKSIIHRDIKPSNLMFTRDRRVKVSDLGLAKVLNENVEMTATGIGIGSPYFIAPEQAADASSVDHRADIYSLGITLLFLLTGQKPFDGNTPYSIVLAHVNKTLPTGAEMGTELPQEVEQLIQKMAAKDPEDRYQTYDALLADVQLVKAGMMPKLAPVRSRNNGRSRKILLASSVAAAIVVPSLLALIWSKSKGRSATDQEVTGASTATLVSAASLSRENAGDRRSGDVGDDRLEGFPRSGPGGLRPMPGEHPEFREGRGPESGGLGMRLPMGPPPKMNRFPLEEAPLATMLKQAEDIAANNPTNYTLQIDAYRQVAEKAEGTAAGREIQRKVDATIKLHQDMVERTIQLHSTRMNEALRSGGPQAAFDAWTTFPNTLRTREVDNRIRGILSEALPKGFSPE